MEDYETTHCLIRGQGRITPAAEVKQRLEQAPLRGMATDAQRIAAFDEAGYLSANGDVQRAVARGATKTGLAHFMEHGLRERRAPMRIDKIWYSRAYPQAACEVGQGDYLDFTEHYILVGKQRGYQPHAEEEK